jgi:hypothetical protein
MDLDADTNYQKKNITSTTINMTTPSGKMTATAAANQL